MSAVSARKCLIFTLFIVVLALTLSACVVYEPYPYPYYPTSQYDRVWESVMRAAEDVGITIFSADRVTGMIVGSKGPSDVTISVLNQADGRIRVQMNVKGPEGANPDLNDRFTQTYQRYMGR